MISSLWQEFRFLEIQVFFVFLKRGKISRYEISYANIKAIVSGDGPALGMFFVM